MLLHMLMASGQFGTIGEYQARLRHDGWTAADMAVRTPIGTVWLVYGHRGAERVVVKAHNQTEAWRKAVRQVEQTFEFGSALQWRPLTKIGQPLPPRRWALAGSCIAQMLGICGAVILAAHEIESIPGTGVILSATGVALAIPAVYRRRIRAAIVFGLSAPVFSVAVFLWIAIMGWGPRQAQVPVPPALIAYEILVFPIMLMALQRAIDQRHAAGERRSFQFGIAALLTTTLIAAVSFAAARLTLNSQAPVLPVAVGAAVAATLIIVVVVVRCVRNSTADAA
jgi:hypothetical protein